VSWSVVFLNEIVAAEFEKLPADMRANFERIIGLIRGVGLERVREPYIKHLEDKLWEMRLRGRDGIARAIYVSAIGRRIVILRVFIKKTQKTPHREILLARQRMQEI